MLNTFKTVSEPETTQIPPEPDTAHPRKSAYAAMGDLQERFLLLASAQIRCGLGSKIKTVLTQEHYSPGSSGQPSPLNSNLRVESRRCSKHCLTAYPMNTSASMCFPTIQPFV